MPSVARPAALGAVGVLGTDRSGLDVAQPGDVASIKWHASLPRRDYRRTPSVGPGCALGSGPGVGSAYRERARRRGPRHRAPRTDGSPRARRQSLPARSIARPRRVQSQHLEVPTTDYEQCGRTDLFERRPGEIRPPREITSRTWSGTSAAAIRAAAAPVLAPNNTTGSWPVSRRSLSHRMAPTSRDAKRGMSNRYVRVRSSICSSSAVSRSISSVA